MQRFGDVYLPSDTMEVDHTWMTLWAIFRQPYPRAAEGVRPLVPASQRWFEHQWRLGMVWIDAAALFSTIFSFGIGSFKKTSIIRYNYKNVSCCNTSDSLQNFKQASHNQPARATWHRKPRRHEMMHGRQRTHRGVFPLCTSVDKTTARCTVCDHVWKAPHEQRHNDTPWKLRGGKTKTGRSQTTESSAPPAVR